MKKRWQRIVICFGIAVFLWSIQLLSDRKTLHDQLIRMHVVANSDSEEDQSVKIDVRDAVLSLLRDDLDRITDVDAARAYLKENLSKIQLAAERTLHAAGMTYPVLVSMEEEAFPIRHYDTFSLPAGVYQTLRITIGEGNGKNWWCVTFPSLCVPATSEGFQETAVGAGFSETMTDTLTGQPHYRVRFYLLDLIGKVENRLFVG